MCKIVAKICTELNLYCTYLAKEIFWAGSFKPHSQWGEGIPLPTALFSSGGEPVGVLTPYFLAVGRVQMCMDPAPLFHCRAAIHCL